MKSAGVLVIALLLLVCATAHAVEATEPEIVRMTTWLREGEFLVDTNIAYAPAPGLQMYPSIAFDGINYLVVWSDNRSGNYDIYGARVNQAGTVLDTSGIVISTAAYDQWYPSVAFDGTDYLVVWGDGRSGGSDIYGARVDQAGTVLDASGIAISTTADYQAFPSVAFDGTNYLVVWLDGRGDGGDIYGARVSQAGAVLDPSGIAISTATDAQGFASVAFDGTNYLVVWYDERSGYLNADIYGARVSQAGTVLDASGIAISTAAYYQESPSVAFDGTNYLVVWQDYRSGNWDIYGTRVSQAGTVLDPSGIAISTDAYYQESPSVAFDGTNYLVVWGDPRSGNWDIYGARVSQAGTVLDPSGIAISTAVGGQRGPSVAFDGTNYLVVWEDAPYLDDPDIYGARVSQAGTVLDPSGIAISTAVGGQRGPSVAFDGTNYLVVWEDYHSDDIYGTRVSQAGTLLDPSSIAISTTADHQGSASVAFDGTNYFVVWVDNRSGNVDIYGARVSQAGTVLDPSGIAISTDTDDQWAPSIAFDGTNYLVVWEDQRSGNDDIYGARLNSSGTVIDSFPVSTQSGQQISLALARGTGNQLLIAYSGWTDYINNHLANTMRIWGKFYPFIGIAEGEKVHESRTYLGPTIFRGPLLLPEGKSCRVFDITGRIVEPTSIAPGIYFLEVDNKIVQKIIKIR